MRRPENFINSSGRRASPHARIGGIAAHHWGEPRPTRDVDATVLLESGDERETCQRLLARFGVRIDDALDFALQNRVLRVRASDARPLDISFGRPRFEVWVIGNAVDIDLGQKRVAPICRAKDFIVYKVNDFGDQFAFAVVTRIDCAPAIRWLLS